MHDQTLHFEKIDLSQYPEFNNKTNLDKISNILIINNL
jgi:hypothetical protein